MKHLLFLFATLTTCHSLYSQEKKDSAGLMVATIPAERLTKNELSIDLVPIIKFAARSQGPFDRKGTLQYKREIKRKMFLRFGVTIMKETPEREFTNIRVHPTGGNDDAVTYNGFIFKPQFDIQAGIEYRWGKRRIKQFTGIDIGYVNKRYTYSEYLAFVPRYSNYDPNNYAYTSYNGPDSTALFNNSKTHVTRSDKTVANGVTLTPFYGMQFHFSRRFFFSMQLGINTQFLVLNRSTTVYTTPYNNANVFEFNLGEGGILNNFSLGFRF